MNRYYLAAHLKTGESCRLPDLRDFVGQSAVTGTYDDKPIRVPRKGEFAAFVLVKKRADIGSLVRRRKQVHHSARFDEMGEV